MYTIYNNVHIMKLNIIYNVLSIIIYITYCLKISVYNN